MHTQSLICVQLFVTPWTRARQALLSMGLSQQEYWSRLPFSSGGDLPDPEIKPASPAWADRCFVLVFFKAIEPPRKPFIGPNISKNSIDFSLGIVNI